MKRYTPDEFAAVLAGLPAAIEAGLRRVTAAVRQRVVAGAVGHMRDARGEPVRRRKDDTGPLRITSRPGLDPVRYLKAVRGGETGSIDRVTETAPLRVSYEMGVDTRVVPQGVNEKTRPTFTRAITEQADELRRIARRVFVDGLRSLVR